MGHPPVIHHCVSSALSIASSRNTPISRYATNSCAKTMSTIQISCYWASSWAYKCSMYQTKYLTSPQIRNAFDLVENALTSANKKMLQMRFHLPHTYTARCYLLPSSLLHFFFSWEFSPFHSQIRITKDLLTQTQMNYLHECFPSFWSRSARRRVKWMGQNAM